MTALLCIAVFPTLILSAQYFGDVQIFGHLAVYFSIIIICVAAAAHQAWSANLFTTVSDMFPKKAVGSVTGIGTMAGGIGGVFIQLLVGHLTDRYALHPQRAYFIMFCICGFSYLISWVAMKLLVPRHKLITDL
jgi:ACS family hexuronate transporter-like MFS transporter